MQSAGFIIFVVWIAASNLVLGFALAVAVGHGPQRLSRRWTPRLSLPRLVFPALGLRLPVRRKPRANIEAAPPTPQAEPEEPAAEAEAVAGAAPDDGIPLDEALAQFQMEVADVRDGLHKVQQRVQACAESPSVDAVEHCVAELTTVGQRILSGRADSLQAIEDASNGSEAHQKAISEVQQASANQATDILQALDDIGLMEVRPESLAEDCQRLKSHTDALSASCESMGQSIEAARPSSDSRQSAVDEAVPTQLERVEASDALDDWWADDPDHQRPLTMVMIDLDGVGALNQEIGETAVDAVLAQVEERVLAANIQGGRATQINAQRFLLLLPKVEPPKLKREVEKLREQIGSIPVQAERSDLQLTASCAIAFSRAGDSARALVARAEAALLEAKQFGGNRTFVNDGDFPTPVISAERQEVAAAM